ncbi:hypothetical protein CALVIDRAFT_274594 [Calocera viscosa TUFC12733]|uniref:MYND-type domain-containing protein n=1 Tax=Calocera viscosa (strain TUFC12733) TaxID=1330018 RepID=A0A167QZ83_CALVF|nr:hypothetical protein CALVIDRAFT_274594 [Calocera viscosa TUFC12733]
MPAVSQPHLPKEFVDGYLRSSMHSTHSDSLSKVFECDMHDLRSGCAVRVYNNFANKTTLFVSVYGTELVGSPLTIAAYTCDYLMACESLRLGADPDRQNTFGDTPLITALVMLVILAENTLGPLRDMAIPHQRELERRSERCRGIARVLVQQHADVNFTSPDRITALSLACTSRDWDMVTLLLRYGADPVAPLHAVESDHPPFASLDDFRQYCALVMAISYSSRPSRLCPCFSGKALADCHSNGVRHAYPSHFLCACGSEKPYGRCCALRMVVAGEEWDEEDGFGFIVPKFPPGFSLELGKMAASILPPEQVKADCQECRATEAATSNLSTNEHHEELTQVMRILKGDLEKLCQDGILDPGYLYALSQVGRVPINHGKMQSKLYCKSLAQEWNAAVDAYIKKGDDERSAADIEEALKLHSKLGALFRRCDGGCGKKQGRDVTKLLRCSKCQNALYCGAACQKAHWKEHRGQCKSKSTEEQPIPAQVVFQKHIVDAPMTIRDELQLWLLLCGRFRMQWHVY